jgi:Holliday junction resolvase-like predicted endonuclease
MSAQIIDVTRGLTHKRLEPQPEYIFHIGSTDGSSGAAISAELSRLAELKGVELRSDHPNPDVLTVVVDDPDAMIGSYLDSVRQHGGIADAVVTSLAAQVVGYFIDDVTHDRTNAEVFSTHPVDPATAAAWADQLLALATRDPLLPHGQVSDLSSYEVAKASWQVISPSNYMAPTPEGLRDLFGSAWRTARSWELSDPGRAAEVERRMVDLLGKDYADSEVQLDFDPQRGEVLALLPGVGAIDVGSIEIGPPPAVRSESGAPTSWIQADDLLGIPAIVRGSGKLLLSAGEHLASKIGREVAAPLAADLADGIVARGVSEAGEAGVARGIAEGVDRTGTAAVAELTPEATALHDRVASLLRAEAKKDADDAAAKMIDADAAAAKMLGGFKPGEMTLVTLTDDVYTLRLGIGNTTGAFGTGSYKTLEEAMQARDQLLAELKSEGLAGFKSRVAVPEGYWEASVDAWTGKYGFSTTTHLQIQRIPAGSVIVEGSVGPQRVLQATVFADTSAATSPEALHQLGEAATTLQGGAHQVAIVTGKAEAEIVSSEALFKSPPIIPVNPADPPGSNALNATTAGKIEPVTSAPIAPPIAATVPDGGGKAGLDTAAKAVAPDGGTKPTADQLKQAPNDPAASSPATAAAEPPAAVNAPDRPATDSGGGIRHTSDQPEQTPDGSMAKSPTTTESPGAVSSGPAAEIQPPLGRTAGTGGIEGVHDEAPTQQARVAPQDDQAVEAAMAEHPAATGETYSGPQRLARGNFGEKAAAEALAHNGFDIIDYKPNIAGTNQGGIDIVAMRGDTVYMIDNKALTRGGNVSSVSALTTNYPQNLAAVRAELVQRIAAGGPPEQIRVLERALEAMDSGRVVRAVTNANLAKDDTVLGGVTDTLRGQGIDFIDVMRPPPGAATAAEEGARASSTATASAVAQPAPATAAAEAAPTPVGTGTENAPTPYSGGTKSTADQPEQTPAGPATNASTPAAKPPVGTGAPHAPTPASGSADGVPNRTPTSDPATLDPEGATAVAARHQDGGVSTDAGPVPRVPADAGQVQPVGRSAEGSPPAGAGAATDVAPDSGVRRVPAGPADGVGESPLGRVPAGPADGVGESPLGRVSAGTVDDAMDPSLTSSPGQHVPATPLSDSAGGDDSAGAGAGISTHGDAGGISTHLDAAVVDTGDQQHGGAAAMLGAPHGVGLPDDPFDPGLPDADVIDAGMAIDPAELGLPDAIDAGIVMDPAELGLPDAIDAGIVMDPAELGLPDGDIDLGMAMDPAELGLPDADGGMADGGGGGVGLPEADQDQVQPVHQHQAQPVDYHQVQPVDQDQLEHIYQQEDMEQNIQQLQEMEQNIKQQQVEDPGGY